MNTPILASLFALTNLARQNNPTPTQRKNIFHLVISVGFIFTLFLSIPLWTSNRDFPIVPLLGENWTLPLPHKTILVLLIGTCFLSLFIPRRNFTTGFIAAISLIAMFEDINRAHPWTWYFTLSFIAIALSKQRDLSFLNTLRILTIFIYFWSGFHKWNLNFFEQSWPYLLEGIIGPELANSWIRNTCYLVPFLEAGMGLGLVFIKTRKIAILGLVSMHIFILLALGPLGRNYNAVVWPWNVVMLVNLLVLFHKEKEWQPKRFRIKREFHSLIILLFGILPLLHTFYLWPSYLSWSIYSKQQSSLLIITHKESTHCINTEGQEELSLDGEIKTFYLVNLANEILHAPNFPHSKVYKAFADKTCRECQKAESIEFIIKERKWRKWASEVLECSGRKPIDQKNLQ